MLRAIDSLAALCAHGETLTEAIENAILGAIGARGLSEVNRCRGAAATLFRTACCSLKLRSI